MSTPNNSSTPTQIIHIVVLTAAVMTLSYFGTLIVMQFVPSIHNDQMFEAFKVAGTGVTSFLFGILVNTRVTKDKAEGDDKPTT